MLKKRTFDQGVAPDFKELLCSLTVIYLFLVNLLSVKQRGTSLFSLLRLHNQISKDLSLKTLLMVFFAFTGFGYLVKDYVGTGTHVVPPMHHRPSVRL